MRKGDANRQKDRFAEGPTITMGRRTTRNTKSSVSEGKDPPKVEEPKTAIPYSASASITTATTIAKTDLQKEKAKEREQRKEEKKEKERKKKPEVMDIPSDEESGAELEIVDPDAGMEVEAASRAANVDPTAMEGETGEEVEEEQQLEQQATETSVPTPDHTYSTTVSSPNSLLTLFILLQRQSLSLQTFFQSAMR